MTLREWLTYAVLEVGGDVLWLAFVFAIAWLAC